MKMKFSEENQMMKLIKKQKQVESIDKLIKMGNAQLTRYRKDVLCECDLDISKINELDRDFTKKEEEYMHRWFADRAKEAFANMKSALIFSINKFNVKSEVNNLHSKKIEAKDVINEAIELFYNISISEIEDIVKHNFCPENEIIFLEDIIRYSEILYVDLINIILMYGSDILQKVDLIFKGNNEFNNEICDIIENSLIEVQAVNLVLCEMELQLYMGFSDWIFDSSRIKSK